MAKRMKSKIQPAVETLTFQFNASDPAAGDFRYIDLSQVASLVNRRFYRQGLNWVVSGFKFSTAEGVSGQILLNKLPNTWVMSNAWEKSFRAWQQMIKNATDESGTESIKPKFLDYKIFANKRHWQSGVASNLMPTSAFNVSWNPATPGQWDMSQVSIPNTIVGVPGDTEEYDLIAVGPLTAGSNYLSLIPGYANSRSLPDTVDPNVPADSDTSENWLVQMFNDGNLQDTEVMEMLTTTGNNPPYPFEGDLAGNTDTMYPGGETQLPTLQPHDNSFVTGTTVGGHTYLKGGNFPCGLVEINLQGFKQGDSLLL